MLDSESTINCILIDTVWQQQDITTAINTQLILQLITIANCDFKKNMLKKKRNNMETMVYIIVELVYNTKSEKDSGVALLF